MTVVPFLWFGHLDFHIRRQHTFFPSSHFGPECWVNTGVFNDTNQGPVPFWIKRVQMLHSSCAKGLSDKYWYLTSVLQLHKSVFLILVPNSTTCTCHYFPCKNMHSSLVFKNTFFSHLIPAVLHVDEASQTFGLCVRIKGGASIPCVLRKSPSSFSGCRCIIHHSSVVYRGLTHCVTKSGKDITQAHRPYIGSATVRNGIRHATANAKWAQEKFFFFFTSVTTVILRLK